MIDTGKYVAVSAQGAVLCKPTSKATAKGQATTYSRHAHLRPIRVCKVWLEAVNV